MILTARLSRAAPCPRRSARRFPSTVASALALLVAATSAARPAFAQPLPPDNGQPPPGTAAPPPPPDEEWDPGAQPPEAQNAPPPPPEAAPPAQPPDQTAFQRELSPYGRWEQTPEFGPVWVPSGVGPNWQPYTDGRWVETAWGWSFVSSVPWGAVVFHYGRWGFRPERGWFWVPGVVWAPAWVSWRYAPGYVCWSPFGPPGFAYPRAWPGWVVVPSRAFTRPIRTHIVPWPHAGPVVRVARVAPSVIVTPRRGSFYGPPREFVHREARVVRVPSREVRRRR
jgi:hypothetical protein